MIEKGLENPQGDPLTALKGLNRTIHDAFGYEVGITQVHSRSITRSRNGAASARISLT